MSDIFILEIIFLIYIIEKSFSTKSDKYAFPAHIAEIDFHPVYYGNKFSHLSYNRITFPDEY